MTPKRVLLLGTLVAAGLMILGWSQTWFVVVGTDGFTIPVPGSRVGGAALATGVATLAVTAALAIASRILRFVLGSITGLLGVIAIAATAFAIADPSAAIASAVTEQTGLSGGSSIVVLVESTTIQAWPWVSLVGGAIAVLAGAGVLVTARRWPAAGSRYERTPTARDDWSALTEGDDPTR